MPLELTIIAVTALLAGLLLVGIMLAGRRSAGAGDDSRALASVAPRREPAEAEPSGAADATLRVVWWLTTTIVLLGVGISGSFAADQAPIFVLGGVAVLAVVLFHEVLGAAQRGRLVRVLEVAAAIALIGGLLAFTGFASSPFAMLFALVAVAAALAYGPRAGLATAGLATAAFAAILLADPRLETYGPEDALRLSIGLGATWLLAFVAVAYAGHQRRTVSHALALSRTDPLTGLFNRSQLFATLDQEVSRTRRSDRGFCVLMIDVDGLKAINDSAGHLRGDDVLRALGAVIRGSIRTVDSAYRYGGDEFVVLLPETDIVGAFVVAEKIRSGAEDVGMVTAEADAMTSVSIGLVSHPEDGLGAEELMIAADRAMYQAKKLGKNQISGNPRPRPALLARRSTIDEPPEPVTVGSDAVEPAPEPPPAVAPAARNGATAPSEDRAIAVELGPVVVAEERPGKPETGDDEPDAQVVRRQIAAASRSFDPDHQIRRAMDAFLSPTAGERDARESRPPDA
ncbi:MAG TPA: GGDEF domain-containing protein [Candidatus Limnocylindria bacterium]|nr:GGDEF domain-containing protein [Candidatus Limnocylindria bacterium]